jgi:tRNA (mo5U34)-methyltransferase
VKRKLLQRWFASRKPPTASELSPEEVQARIASVDHWYHQIEVAPDVITPGLHNSKAALESLELPESMKDKRVLDVGARDGFFSFAAEARGAEVLAIDSVAREHLRGFSVASTLLGSKVEYRTVNVYNLSPKRVGTFDAIFFLGVLYHLRDPMLALDRLWEVARPGATIWVESHTIDNGLVNPETGVLDALSSVAPALTKIPIAQFYPRRMLGSNFTNWWGPNLAGLEAMVEASGFKVGRSRTIGSRGLVVATREEDTETSFYRRFDREEGTGEEGMSWSEKAGWSKPKFGWSRNNLRDAF